MPDPPQNLRRVVEQAGSLYSLPAVAVEVLHLTESPKVDVLALKQCIENDPALAAKIVKVVNSPAYASGRSVADLNQALSLLGTQPLKLLVLGFSLPKRLFTSVAGPTLTHYWRRALTKSVAARELYETFWQPGGGEAFLAGLVADLGMLVLVGQLQQPYVEFLEEVRSEGGDLLQLERQSLGFDHTQLTAELLIHWHFPKPITTAIAADFSDESMTRSPSYGTPMVQVLHLAELLAGLVVDHRMVNLKQLLAAAKTYCGATRQQVAEIVDRLGECVAQLAEVLSLDLPDGREYDEVIREAHQRLAQQAELAAGQLGNGKDASTPTEALQRCAANLASAAADAFPENDLDPVSGAAVQPDVDGDFPGRHPREPLHSSRRALQGGRPLETRATCAPTGSVKSVSPAAVSVVKRTKVSAGPVLNGVDQFDPGLLGRLEAAIGQCRHERTELSLLLIELQPYADLLALVGDEAEAKIEHFLRHVCETMEDDEFFLAAATEGCFGLILPERDRQAASHLAGQLARNLPSLSEVVLRLPWPISLCIGVATVAAISKNFAAGPLIEAAQRCLSGAKSCGGGYKTIEIY